MFATASILMRIRHLGDGLPPTARRIATYIAEHADEVIRMSITEVAEQTDASEGSIVGLCRRLGASGFQELKILLSRDLVEPMRMIHEDLRPSDTVADVAQHVFAAHIASLQETQKLLDQKTLGRAVEIVRDSKRVEVYGIGSAAPIAQDLGYRLLQHRRYQNQHLVRTSFGYYYFWV